MNDDQRLLANAYLDGEITADERARAEADPEVVAEVARLGSVRDALGATEQPDPARRDAAIAAALAAFEVRPAATIATTPDRPVAPPTSLDARRHRRWFGPLAAAAAVVVVIAGGVAVLRDSDSGGGDEDAADSPAEATQAARDELTAAEPEVASDAAGTAAPAATEAATEMSAAAATAGEGGAVVVLTSPEDLAAFAAGAGTAATAGTTADRALGCGLGELVGTATYVRDGQSVTVDVFVDAGEAIAAEPTTCDVVARAQLP